MSFIQVPIGKGITKFPKIKRSQPEEKFGTFPSIPSDRQFLKDLADQDRLIITQQQTALAARPFTVVSFVPDNGTTFYFLGASCSTSNGGSEHAFELQSDGVVIEGATRIAEGVVEFKIPTFSLIGDGTKAVEIICTVSANGTFDGTILGYIVKSPRT